MTLLGLFAEYRFPKDNDIENLAVTPIPAQQLVGMNLSGDWKVIELISRPPEATGGNFSQGYVVENLEGKQAFLKALDLSAALENDEPTLALELMPSAYNHERDLLEVCRGRNLDRVAISTGDGTVPGRALGSIIPVPYLIFELADGDIRRHLDTFDEFDLAWSLRSLHHAATGLRQLHNESIAHQDLKPSNVLVFGNTDSKISDLGRATSTSRPGPFGDLPIAGDQSYAPPELLYRYIPSDWNQRRFGCDAYLLGSLAVFFFTRLSMTSLWLSELHHSQHHMVWAGTFAEILPFIRNAFGSAMLSFENDVPPSDIKSELVESVRQLCDPDPGLRGHPITRARLGNPFSLERYVALYDLLARRAELSMKRMLS